MCKQTKIRIFRHKKNTGNRHTYAIKARNQKTLHISKRQERQKKMKRITSISKRKDEIFFPLKSENFLVKV